MYLMLQADQADTFVLATNRTLAVRDFVNLSFQAVDVELEWTGSGEGEIAVDASSGKTVVKVNPRYYRPAEVDLLIGDADKAHKVLGWAPETTLETLCSMMVSADLKRNESGFSF
jgi:GDPmannose 4,6-dehydratase